MSKQTLRPSERGGMGAVGALLVVALVAALSLLAVTFWGGSRALAGPPVPQAPTVSKTAAGSYDAGSPATNVKVTGIITVTNDNGPQIDLTSVTDVLSDGTTCTVTGGTGPTVNHGDTTFNYTCSLSGLPAGSLTNTATIAWSEQTVGGGTLDAGTAHSSAVTVAFTENAEPKEIDAKALTDHGCSETEWHFVITGIDDPSDAPASIEVTFANGDVVTVYLDKVTGGTAHYATTEDLDSWVTGATAEIYPDWDGQFNLSHGPCTPLIDKDAAGSYDLVYDWDIAKTVTPVAGTIDTFTYGVTVTRLAPTIENGQVSGTITLTSRISGDFTIDSVTDELSDDTQCTVTYQGSETLPTTLPAAGLTFDYVCDLTEVPGSEITNTATVSWPAQFGEEEGVDAGSRDTDPVSVEFTETQIGECVDVTDTLEGDLGVDVCATTTFTSYDLTFPVPAAGCVDHPNTATFVATDDPTITGSDDGTAQVCAVGIEITIPQIPGGPGPFTLPTTPPINEVLPAEVVRQPINQVLPAEVQKLPPSGDPGWQRSSDSTLALMLASSLACIALAMGSFAFVARRRQQRR